MNCKGLALWHTNLQSDNITAISFMYVCNGLLKIVGTPTWTYKSSLTHWIKSLPCNFIYDLNTTLELLESQVPWTSETH